MLEASLQGNVLLQATHFSMKGQYGSLGDQDYIHNLKKMINPLDHISKDIKLGEIVQQQSRIEKKTDVLRFIKRVDSQLELNQFIDQLWCSISLCLTS